MDEKRVITSITFDLTKMTKYQLDNLKSAFLHEMKEVREAINNYHIWALGSKTQEEAIENEKYCDMEKQYLELLKSIFNDICEYEKQNS